MLDINFIRQNPKKVMENNQIRGCNVSVKEILDLDEERRAIAAKLDDMRAKRNQVSSQGQKPSSDQLVKMKELKDKIKDQELVVGVIEDKLNLLLVQLPNITHKSTPVGKDESENVVVRKWSLDDPKNGSIKSYDFLPKPHWELAKNLDLIDEAQGAKVSGSRFWYLKNELVYLEFALVQYALEFLRKEKFVPILPPMIVRERAMYGTGFFPADKNEIYKLANPEEESNNQEQALKPKKNTIPSWDNPDQFLVGTAEVPLAAYHADQTIEVGNTALKYCGFSSCFRREAGTYGKDIKGILRGHQFDKIEMFVFASKEDSWDLHEQLTAIAEKFWQSLGVPYQVVLMCSYEIGAPNAKKYDIEAWMPGEGKYREVVSASNDTDFQGRRLNIKYKDKAGESRFVHTLNSTLIAIGRGIIAIMENYQTKEGTVKIPEVLQKYMMGITEIKSN